LKILCDGQKLESAVQLKRTEYFEYLHSQV